MDLREEILLEHSKVQTHKIGTWIGKNQEKFDALMQLYFGDNVRITQRSANVISYCHDRYPFLITPHLEKMVALLEKPPHVSVTRNTIRILQNIYLPESILGKVTQLCFDFLANHQSPIAVKAFSMTVLANVCEREPDLSPELKLLIEEQMPYGSVGFRSRGKKILNRLG